MGESMAGGRAVSAGQGWTWIADGFGQDDAIDATACPNVAVLGAAEDVDLDAAAVEGTRDGQTAVVGLQEDGSR